VSLRTSAERCNTCEAGVLGRQQRVTLISSKIQQVRVICFIAASVTLAYLFTPSKHLSKVKVKVGYLL